MFVYFLGPNGAGKSTQINLLIRWLKARGSKVKVAYVQCNHLPILILEGIIIKLGRFGFYTYPDGKRVTVPSAEILLKIRYLWFCIQFLSIVFLSFIRVHLPLRMGYVVVAERYVLDSISDFCMFSSNLRVKASFLSRMVKVLLYLMPKGTVIVHLDAPYDVLKRRFFERGSVVEPREYIEMQRKCAPKLIEALGHTNIKTIHVDSSVVGVPEIFNMVKRLLTSSQARENKSTLS